MSTNSYTRTSHRPVRKQNSSDGFLHVFLFYVLPFIIFNAVLFYAVTAVPKVSLEVGDTNDYLTTKATLTLESFYPVKSISLSLDGESLEMTKEKGRTYTIPISKNGVLEATVENWNSMSSTIYEHINVLDENPPAFEEPQIIDGVVTLTVTDSQSGVNFDSIYALDSNGERVEPLTVDRSTNTLSFEMDPDGLNVFAQDKAGLKVEARFTSHKEGGVETVEGVIAEPDNPDGTEISIGDEAAGSEAADTDAGNTEAADSSSSGN